MLLPFCVSFTYIRSSSGTSVQCLSSIVQLHSRDLLLVELRARVKKAWMLHSLFLTPFMSTHTFNSVDTESKTLKNCLKAIKQGIEPLLENTSSRNPASDELQLCIAEFRMEGPNSQAWISYQIGSVTQAWEQGSPAGSLNNYSYGQPARIQSTRSSPLSLKLHVSWWTVHPPYGGWLHDTKGRGSNRNICYIDKHGSEKYGISLVEHILRTEMEHLTPWIWCKKEFWNRKDPACV